MKINCIEYCMIGFLLLCDCHMWFGQRLGLVNTLTSFPSSSFRKTNVQFPKMHPASLGIKTRCHFIWGRQTMSQFHSIHAIDSSSQIHHLLRILQKKCISFEKKRCWIDHLLYFLSCFKHKKMKCHKKCRMSDLMKIAQENWQNFNIVIRL